MKRFIAGLYQSRADLLRRLLAGHTRGVLGNAQSLADLSIGEFLRQTKPNDFLLARRQLRDGAPDDSVAFVANRAVFGRGSRTCQIARRAQPVRVAFRFREGAADRVTVNRI